MKNFILVLFIIFFNSMFAQDKPVGVFHDHADVGNPAKAGSTTYDATSQSYTLKGAGYNIWFGRDEFQYAYRRLKGDFVLTANFEFVGPGVSGHRKIGWMIRESTAADAAHMTATIHGGDGLIAMQWRSLRGGSYEGSAG